MAPPKLATNQLRRPVRPKVQTLDDAERGLREHEEKLNEPQDLVRQILEYL